ncbi:MAG: hypothetical protein QW579_04475 [Desulfurococcaceae archaeon]
MDEAWWGEPRRASRAGLEAVTGVELPGKRGPGEGGVWREARNTGQVRKEVNSKVIT